MPLTAAQTSTAMTAAATKSTKGGQVITVDFVFDGVDYVPSAFYAMLDATYGTVTSDADTVDGGRLRLRIAP